MPTNVSEMNLEDMILAYLRDKQGYEEGTTSDYVKDYALDTERVKRFLLSTQRQKVENTACFANAISERKFFSELAKQLANRGVTGFELCFEGWFGRWTDYTWYFDTQTHGTRDGKGLWFLKDGTYYVENWWEKPNREPVRLVKK